MILIIKKIKRAGYGFTNSQHYQRRLLAYYGLKKQTRRVVSMRGQGPHLAA